MPLRGPHLRPRKHFPAPALIPVIGRSDPWPTYAPPPPDIGAMVGAGPRALHTRISEHAPRNDILRCTKWGCARLASAQSVHGQRHIVPCLSWTFPP